MSLTNEGKENTLSGQDKDNILRTPVQQIKRTESIIKGSRRPLASKDNNRTQTILGGKQNILSRNALKRPASSFANNLSGNKLKKYGSVLGMSGFMPRAKSLVLKDTEDEEPEQLEDEEDDDQEEEIEGSIALREGKGLSGLGGGLNALIRKRADELSIEYAPKREKEIQHIPNGYEEFAPESIQKLKEFRSPFEVEKINFSTEYAEPDLISLNEPESLPEKLTFGLRRITTKTSESEEDVPFELSEEYNGHGLDSSDLNSLLD